jgi:hypothetical protein
VSKSDRLSSNFLFHYKKDINILKLILQHGFRHSMWDEKVIFRDSVQQNFVVCFCDILADQADFHKECYGNMAIVLTKEWGIKNNITPVRYVHSNSIGQLDNYIKLKNINRSIWSKYLGSKDLSDYAINYLAVGIAKDNGQLVQPTIEQSELANPKFSNFLSELDTEFKDIESELKKTGNVNTLYKYFHHMGIRLHELHNELEKRDALMRVYQDDFDCPSGKSIIGKILYDEREWRSVRFISSVGSENDTNEYEEAVNNRFLPERFNLKFTNDDLIALLFENTSDKDEVLNFLKFNTTLIDYHKVKNKVMLFSDFHE